MYVAACLVLVKTLDAVTFASQPGAVYVPAREAANLLGWSTSYDSLVELLTINGTTLDPLLPKFSDGTILISLAELKRMGAPALTVRIGAKRVSIDLKAQRLKAWQGACLVYDWPVSTGREAKQTPNGDFKAGKKEPMHISTLYGSPMPFSVHITGNIFIHGSASFSSAPGSHGCIRLPLMERRNIAEEFYNWIEPGTPVRITGAYKFR